MNRYSNLDKILYRQFLGDNQLSNFLFNNLLSNNRTKKNSFRNSKHIFITGLARSGTTALLNRIYSCQKIPSILYKHMPFILSPKLASIYSKFSKTKISKIERFHNDKIYINLDSPECFDEIFWNKYYQRLNNFNLEVPESIDSIYLDAYAFLLGKFAEFQSGNTRLLIKNNNNHLRIKILANYFYNSKFLILYRSPLDHSISLLKQHLNFIKLQSEDKFILEYMNYLNHREFGLNLKKFKYPNFKSQIKKKYSPMSPNYWLSQWIETYQWILNLNLKSLQNVHLIGYEDLCKNSDIYKYICEKCEITITGNNFKFVSYQDDSKYKFSENLVEKSNIIYESLKVLSSKF